MVRPALFLAIFLFLPIILSFSALNTYGAQYINESNLYNLTFENLTVINQTIGPLGVAMYTINITNYGNDTSDEYNLSLSGIGALSSTSINLSMNESIQIGINVSNTTQENYETYIIANYWNGTATNTSWNLTSYDDGIVTNTTVDATAPTITVVSPTNTTYSSLPINLNVTTTTADTCLYNIG
ncbi:MAG: hypothetical protein JRI49_02095, partial [Deltaproteobacteria bacterium]|nr:hypothetical protein [Deltaproteobacteria bacterium]